MPSDEMVEKACAAYWECYREAWRPLGLLGGEFDVPFAELPPNTKQLTTKAMEAALSAAHAEPVACDPSRFSRLSPDERPVIRERPDPTLGFISTAEMLASPSEAAIRADEREKCAKVLDDEARKWLPGGPFDVKGFCTGIATAIRARGER